MTGAQHSLTAPVGAGRVRVGSFVVLSCAAGVFEVRGIDHAAEKVTLAHLTGAAAGTWPLHLVSEVAGEVPR